MSKRNYKPMNLIPFARHTIRSKDLDPIYYIVNEVGWPMKQKLQFFASYLAYYHAGVAAYMSTMGVDTWWTVMMLAAENRTPSPLNERWPRAKERRHFRGQQAIKAVTSWHEEFKSPQELFLHFLLPEATVADSMLNAQKIRSVGQWMSFKIADITDACFDMNLDQTGDLTPFFYDTPVKGMLDYWRDRMGFPPHANPPGHKFHKVLQEISDYVADQLSAETNPHKSGEPLDPFCLETVFCKWKSHCNGHYPLYNDLMEVGEGLLPWAQINGSAAQLLEALPEVPENE